MLQVSHRADKDAQHFNFAPRCPAKWGISSRRSFFLFWGEKFPTGCNFGGEDNCSPFPGLLATAPSREWCTVGSRRSPHQSIVPISKWPAANERRQMRLTSRVLHTVLAVYGPFTLNFKQSQTDSPRDKAAAERLIRSSKVISSTSALPINFALRLSVWVCP